MNTSVVRLPQVHDTFKQGLVPYVTMTAKQKGKSVYIGDGGNRWPAAHVSAVAQLYRLAFEKGGAGRHLPCGRRGRCIDEGDRRGIGPRPQGAGGRASSRRRRPRHFGWLGHFIGHDMPSSSAITQQKLGWTPTGPGMIADLDGMDYSKI